jgi:hypothetical protein
MDENALKDNLSIKLWDKLGKLSWMPFSDARNFVRLLGLRSGLEWNEYLKQNKLPRNIPNRPSSVYSNEGWIGIADWLGIEPRTSGKIFMEFEDAREFIRNQNLQSREEYLKYLNSVSAAKDIPKYPNQAYKNNGWISWGDWLGTGRIADNLKEYKSFEEARIFARELKLLTRKSWEDLASKNKLPSDIPKVPQHVYKSKGWKGFADFLGLAGVRGLSSNFLEFQEARDFVHRLGLKNWTQWRLYKELPPSIPRNAAVVYKNKGWVNWGDWLGTNNLANTAKDFLDYEQSKKVMAKMKLSSGTDWRALRAKGLKPKNIPVNPDIYYLDKGWISWGDWLGTGRVANSKKNHLSYTEAKSIVQKLELKSELEWRAWKKHNSLPAGVPAKPETVYKSKGWVSFADFLGVSQERRFFNYEDAKKAIQKFKFKSIKEFEICQKNGEIDSKVPANPYNYYKKSNEWISFKDFLGKV